MHGIKAILLDIEGTVSPISFVHEVLFPYARQRIESFLRERGSEAVVAAAAQLIVEEDRAKNGVNPVPLPDRSDSAFSIPRVRDAAWRLMDCDSKTTGLKQLQGLIWDVGYRNGELKSPMFEDVAPAIARWNAAGKKVAIYSSGSIAAQKAFFSHTVAGDLTRSLGGFFDTTSGPKRSPASYTNIIRALDNDPAKVLFLSDVPEELSAARQAGLQVMLVVRPGNAKVPDSVEARRVTSFDTL